MNLNTFAQETISPAKQKAMEKLEFIVGQWSGGGWMMNREGEKQTFKQTEAIQWKVGKAIILIEGQGKQGEKIVHDALAIISYDETADQYNFRSYLASGREGSYTATIEEDQTFIWAIEAPGVTIKYTIQVKDDHWHEIGEMKRGESWFQFFEMDLDRLTK
ncbi:MAG: hypothetical protein DHS20C18_41640 [Saprospiraceae bacterium]|nr:MAG: hypothetical protein DHS20C18_41640 [Saprospiraceae bacterium]